MRRGKRLRGRGLRWATVAGALVALAGCANAAPGVGAGQTPSPTSEPSEVVAGGQPIDWENPIAIGVPLPSLDALGDVVSFQPVLPAMGEPLNLLVNDPESFDELDRGFGAQYETADGGLFWLLEEPSDMAQKDLEGIPAQCDPAEGCQGKWSLTTLDDGTVGLLVEGPVSVGLVWLHKGIYLDVIGQPGDVTGGEAIEAANSVVAQYQ